MKRPLSILLSIFVATAIIGLGFRFALALNYVDFSGADTQDIRWPAGQTLSFVQGGSERLRIDATTGNVVIPQGLTVNGTFSMTGTYTGSVSAGNISAGDFGSNYGGGIFSFPGNVGIGTTGPVSTLQIKGAYGTWGTVLIGDPGVTTSTSLALGAGNSAASRTWQFLTNDAVEGDLAIRQSTTQTGSTFATKVTINPNGNVGIGTTSPGYKLSVEGSASINGNLYVPAVGHGSSGGFLEVGGVGASYYGGTIRFYGGLHATNPGAIAFHTGTGAGLPGEVMRINSSGNVGIGTTSPAVKLDIEGNLKIYNGGGGWSYVLAADGRQLSLGVDNGITLNLTGGNVGIGTTSPGAKLQVDGVSSLVGDMYYGMRVKDPSTSYTTMPRTGIVFNTLNRDGGGWDFAGIQGGKENATDDVHYGFMSFHTSDGPWGTLTEKMRITSGGNVGIGYTDTSGNKLAVNGTIYSPTSITAGTQLCIGASCQSSWPGSQWAVSGANIYNTNSGNVGIGTTSPAEKLQVAGAVKVTGVITTDTANSGAMGYQGGFRFISWGADAATKGSYSFEGYSSNGSVNASYLTITNSGNVGIGTTGPNKKLHILDTSDGNLVYGLKLENGAAPETANTATGILFAAGDTASAPRGKGGLIYNLPSGSVWGKGDFHFLQNTVSDATNAGLSNSVMTIKNNGDVGIGTTSPSQKLEVSSGYVKIKVKGTSSDAWVWADGFGANNSGFQAGTDGTIRVQIDGALNQNSFFNTGGNVGIGTTGPSLKLTVDSGVSGAPATSGTSQSGGAMRMDGVDNGVLDFGELNDGLGSWWIQATDKTDLSAKYKLLLNPNGGNVGIGTTGPGSKVSVLNTNAATVYGGQAIGLVSQATAIGDKLGISFAQDAVEIRARAGIYAIAERANGYASSLGFYTRDAEDGTTLANTDEKMRITSSGNVGIGTTSPGGTLTVKPQGNSWQDGITLITSDGSRTFMIHPEIGAGYGLMLDGGGQGFSFYSGDVRFLGGNVGIGYTDTSGNKLAVNGTIYATTINASASGGLCIAGDCKTAWSQVGGGAWTLSGNNLYPNSTSYNVGIGTTGPISTLQVGSFAMAGGDIATAGSSAITFNLNSSAATTNADRGYQLTLLESSALGANKGGAIGFQAVYDASSNIATIAGIKGLRENGTADNFSGYLQFLTRGTAGSNVERMRITSTGNVGIGTTNPHSLLEVSSSAPQLHINDVNGTVTSDSTGYIVFTHGTSGTAHSSIQMENGTMGFDTAGAGNFAFTGGNVGIGTTSPGAKLHIAGTGSNNYFTVEASDTSANTFSEMRIKSGSRSAYLWTMSEGSSNYGGDGALNVYSESGPLLLWTASTEKVRITSAGNVGIGTTSPASPLHISSNLSGTNVVQFYNTNSTGYGPYIQAGGGASGRYMFYIADYAGSGKMIVDSSGNVGIGTNPGTDILSLSTVSAQTTLQSTTGTNATFGRYVNTGGTAYVGLNGSATNGLFTTSGLAYAMTIRGAGANAIQFGHTNAEVTIIDGGNVGIGTTSPNILFQTKAARNGDWVGGFVNTGTTPYGLYIDTTANAGSQYTLAAYTNAGTGMFVLNNGNVGIGTTSPGSNLDIQGVSTTGLFFGASNSGARSGIIDFGSGNVQYGYNRTVADAQQNAATYSWASVLGSQSIDSIQFSRKPAGGAWSTLFKIDNSGNVGIGTTSPGYKLEVESTATGGDGIGVGYNGSVKSVWRYNSSANYDTVFGALSNNALTFVTGGVEKMRISDNSSGGNVGIGYTDTSGNKLAVNGAIYSSSSITAGTQLCIGASCQSFWPGSQWTTSGANIYNSNSGNVGIGTTGPIRKLQVGGGATGVYEMQIGGGTVGQSASLDIVAVHDTNAFQVWDDNDLVTPKFIVKRAGNVGIGTTGPKKLLNVHGTAAVESGTGATTITDATVALKLGTTGTRAGSGYYMAGIGFANLWNYGGGSGYDANNHAWIGTYHESTPGSELAALVFATNPNTDNSGLPAERMRISSGGNVGIGTTTPGYKLDVAGAINSTGGIVTPDIQFYGSQKIYNGDNSYLYIRSNSTAGGIRLMNNSTSSVGYLYGDGSSFGLLTAGGSWAVYMDQSSNWYASSMYDKDNTGYYVNPAGESVTNVIQSNSYFSRGSHSSGYLAGGYNNIGGNSTYSNPIFTIGTSYAPSDSSLLDMYGIGYSHGNFWGSAGGRTTGWGMYVASDGDIRVILDAENGVVWSSGSTRSPIFYDTDNTSYYVNPAGSTSAILNGSVGIGTTNPTAKLQVISSNSIAISGSSSYDNGIAGSTSLSGAAGVYGYATASGSYGVYGDAQNSISGTGVYGSGRSYGIYGTNPSSSNYAVYGTHAGGNGTAVGGVATGSSGRGVYASSSGTYGYGVYGSASGTSAYGIYCYSSNNAAGCNGNRAWSGTSDGRLKTNIVTIENALEKVQKLRGVYFTWKNDSLDRREMGFIAQETLPVIPEVVGKGPEGYYSMTTSQLTAVLVEAVKELASSASGQKDEIAALSASWRIARNDIESLLAMMGRFTIDENGTLTVKKLVTDELELGGYCVKVVDGELKAEEGRCK